LVWVWAACLEGGYGSQIGKRFVKPNARKRIDGTRDFSAGSKRAGGEAGKKNLCGWKRRNKQMRSHHAALKPDEIASDRRRN